MQTTASGALRSENGQAHEAAAEPRSDRPALDGSRKSDRVSREETHGNKALDTEMYMLHLGTAFNFVCMSPVNTEQCEALKLHKSSVM